MRYRVVYDTDPSGAFSEFSADTDEDAIDHIQHSAHIYGRAISLHEGGAVGVQRGVPL